jgi:RNA polymerase sigma-70 factor (ECF subfamily)
MRSRRVGLRNGGELAELFAQEGDEPMPGDLTSRRDPKDDTDVRLLSAAAAGDQPAWEELYVRYADNVYRWCRRRGLPQEDAEDVAQEVFWCIHERLEHFQRGAEGSFRGWLYRICERRISDHQRKFARGRLRAVAADLDKLASPVSRGDPRDALLAEALQRVRRRVSARTWALFEAYFLQDRSAAEVAREYGISRYCVYHARTRVVWLLRVEIDAAALLRLECTGPINLLGAALRPSPVG